MFYMINSTFTEPLHSRLLASIPDVNSLRNLSSKEELFILEFLRNMASGSIFQIFMEK